jgi:hypothetical protein
VTARDRLLASLSPELVAALEELVDERLAAARADRGAETWPEWMNIQTAAR